MAAGAHRRSGSRATVRDRPGGRDAAPHQPAPRLHRHRQQRSDRRDPRQRLVQPAPSRRRDPVLRLRLCERSARRPHLRSHRGQDRPARPADDRRSRRHPGRHGDGRRAVFTPDILQAFANASKPGAHPDLAQLAADPRLAEAVARLAAWDQSTPTGIRQGFDAGDAPGRLSRTACRGDGRTASQPPSTSVWRNHVHSRTWSRPRRLGPPASTPAATRSWPRRAGSSDRSTPRAASARPASTLSIPDQRRRDPPRPGHPQQPLALTGYPGRRRLRRWRFSARPVRKNYRSGVLHRVIFIARSGPPSASPRRAEPSRAARPGAGQHPGQRRLSPRRPRPQRMFQRLGRRLHVSHGADPSLHGARARCRPGLRDGGQAFPEGRARSWGPFYADLLEE